jgi:hypothetical protein
MVSVAWADGGPDGGTDGGAMDAGTMDAGLPDGGDTDSGDTDTDTGPGEWSCDDIDDDCCLDNAIDEEVAALQGCNGGPFGTAEPGYMGGECAYPSSESVMACGGYPCWSYPNWYDGYYEPTGGECGICLRFCSELLSCPDGINDLPDAGGEYTYDFCTSDCPEGMRCWVYDYNSTKRGLCVIDCWSDDDCSSGICDPLWNICVPREEECPEYEPDTDEDAGWDPDTEVDAGFDASPQPGTDTGGCACNAAGAAPVPSLLRLLSWSFR